MSTVLLVRHGLTALTGPVLSGRTTGVHLDERGRAQAENLAQRMATLPLAAVVTSPLERCIETAEVIAAAQAGSLQPQVDERLIECGYGDWTGRPLKELARDPLWKQVQAQPSAVRFPNGESLPEVAARSVQAVRDWDGRLSADALWVACSHGDVIKAVLADALATHLDNFQRIVVDPGSISVVHYTDTRPFVARVNDLGGDVAGLIPPKPKRRRKTTSRSSDAVVGGSTGT
jgi:probable phosphomutase (TIGR03848 family)